MAPLYKFVVLDTFLCMDPDVRKWKFYILLEFDCEIGYFDSKTGSEVEFNNLNSFNVVLEELDFVGLVEVLSLGNTGSRSECFCDRLNNLLLFRFREDVYHSESLAHAT